MRLFAALVLFPFVLPGVASAFDASDRDIVAGIIKESRAAYHATGRPCACPDDSARNGSRCGARSAYSRPGGASPKCYPQDVTAAEIAAYRARLRSPR